MPSLKLEELRVYQPAEAVADAVWDVVSTWESFARDRVGRQLVRAADGIGANIAEGFGRGSFADNKRVVRIARGSLCETRYFLPRADQRSLLTPDQRKSLQPLLKALPPAFNAYVKSIGQMSPLDEETAVTNDQ
jgi:four helix bundle protein